MGQSSRVPCRYIDVVVVLHDPATLFQLPVNQLADLLLGRHGQSSPGARFGMSKVGYPSEEVVRRLVAAFTETQHPPKLTRKRAGLRCRVQGELLRSC